MLPRPQRSPVTQHLLKTWHAKPKKCKSMVDYHATLWRVVEDGSLDHVEQLFPESLNLAQEEALANSVSSSGVTILMKAVEHDRLDIVECLMKHGADATTRFKEADHGANTDEGRTGKDVSFALSQAAANGNLEIVTYFWENHKDKFKLTHIHDALAVAIRKSCEDDSKDPTVHIKIAGIFC